VAHKTPERFAVSLSELSGEERIRQVSDHLFLLARIAKRKYTLVAFGILSGTIGGADVPGIYWRRLSFSTFRKGETCKALLLRKALETEGLVLFVFSTPASALFTSVEAGACFSSVSSTVAFSAFVAAWTAGFVSSLWRTRPTHTETIARKNTDPHVSKFIRDVGNRR
jgi:hypothetical protein